VPNFALLIFWIMEHERNEHYLVFLVVHCCGLYVDFVHRGRKRKLLRLAYKTLPKLPPILMFLIFLEMVFKDASFYESCRSFSAVDRLVFDDSDIFFGRPN
jgi:hypothetical protein